ncbi:MAG: hypothetical protein JNK66_14805 [Chitinophagales bacterium]|nr:hypothetical protein [Chitinophagales bacterium]
MLKHLLQAIFFIPVMLIAGGYEIKLSTVMDKPGVEFLGYKNDSWYAIGFEKPGNLNKPPRYTLYKYALAFKSGKASVLYPSFGEKTFYLQSGFNGNKISMYYAVCDRRSDEEWMMENRDSRKQLPVIMRQNFDANTLEPDTGGAQLIFDEKDEYFTCSGILLAHSPDGSKSAVLIKPYYKQQRFKLLIADAKSGTSIAKTYDFKEQKEYLQFLQMQINNDGQVYITARVRDDVISLAPTTKNKPQNTYYIFSADANTPLAEPYKIASPNSGLFYANPLSTLSQNGELVLAFDSYTDELRTLYRSTAMYRVDAKLNLMAKTQLSPSADVTAQCQTSNGSKKGKEFYKFKTQQIVNCGKGYGVLVEYADTTAAQKTIPAVVISGNMLVFQTDDNMQQKANWLILKKQQSATVQYAFSARIMIKNNELNLLYNADWEADEEHFMNLMHTRLPADGSAAVTTKVVRTSDDFFINFSSVWTNGNRIAFRQEKLVDFEDVGKEIRFLEITLK